MPVATVTVSTILTVVKLIATAAATASHNKRACQDLAERAAVLSYVLDQDSFKVGNDTARAILLCRLQNTVDDALELVESCQQYYCGSSRSVKVKLEYAGSRINNCIQEISLLPPACPCRFPCDGAPPAGDHLAVAGLDHGRSTNNSGGSALHGHLLTLHARSHPALPAPSQAAPAPGSGKLVRVDIRYTYKL